MYWCWVFSADWSRIVVFIYLTQVQAIRSITIVVFHVICCVKSEHRSWFLTVPTVNSWQSFWLRLFTLASISLKIKFHRINTSQNLYYKNSTTILPKIRLFAPADIRVCVGNDHFLCKWRNDDIYINRVSWNNFVKIASFTIQIKPGKLLV